MNSPTNPKKSRKITGEPGVSTSMNLQTEPKFREVVDGNGQGVSDRRDRPRHPGAFTGVDGMAAMDCDDGHQLLRIRVPLGRGDALRGARMAWRPHLLAAGRMGVLSGRSRVSGRTIAGERQ